MTIKRGLIWPRSRSRLLPDFYQNQESFYRRESSRYTDLRSQTHHPSNLTHKPNYNFQMSTNISVDSSRSLRGSFRLDVTPTSVETVSLTQRPTLSSWSRSDDEESDGTEECQVPLVSEEITIEPGRELGQMGQTDIVPATEYEGSQDFMPASVVSRGLSPTAHIFISAGEFPIADSPAVVSFGLSATAPVFIPSERMHIPVTNSTRLSATAPVFISSGPNNIPYLLCVAANSKSVRRQGCLNQILEQIDIARQVEMDARRGNLEYGVDWM